MKIKITDMDTPAMFLMNAVATHFADDKFSILETLNLKPEDKNVLEVKLTANGVEIPFDSTIEFYWRQCVADRDKHALELAKKLVTGAGLDDLLQKLREAEWLIEHKLKEALEKLDT